MPTGYTAAIEKGITFSQFALQCARNFGALIEMRDEPMDAPIPDEFEAHGFYHNSLVAAQKELLKVRAMTESQCVTAAEKEHKSRVATADREIEKMVALRAKYEAMLAQVEAWTPPSPEHEGLKEFMREQITESIKFDCHSDYYERVLQVPTMGGLEWKANRVANLEADVARYQVEAAKDRERMQGRTTWVRLLKESLGAVAGERKD